MRALKHNLPPFSQPNPSVTTQAHEGIETVINIEKYAATP